MKALYDTKPTKLEAVGNGSFLYRYNIEEIKVDTQDQEPRTQWQCDEATVYAPLTANKITEVVITAEWATNYEQKLSNEYEAAKLGIYEDPEAQTKINKYIEFLASRKKLKDTIDADCKELGID